MKIIPLKRIVLFLFAGMLIFASSTYASIEHFELVVSNQSHVFKHHAIVPVDIPEAMQNHFISVSRNQQTLPSLLSPDRKQLLIQLDLGPEEESILTISFSTKPLPESFLAPSTAPGTQHVCINYQRLLIISAQDENEINFKTRENQLLETVHLNRGQMHVFNSSNPQFLIIESQHPVFIYLSSIGDGKLQQDVRFEAGDSDTTTLFGSDIYFFTDRHLWVSSYEEASVRLHDVSGFLVWEDKLQANSGILVPQLSPGAYHLTSTTPVTLQFGYLDDENYSFVFGKHDQINGFAFGNLLISALHPNTTAELTYFNPRRQQKKLTFKQSGDYEWIPIIELFLPHEPEYAFFTLSFDKPLLVNTFSSGTNFGGDFVPGRNGLFADYYFSYMTPKLSREFSKEQKNMLEIIGLYQETSINIFNAIQEKIELQQNTSFNFLTHESLSWTRVEGSQPFMLSQLHNYTQKGLFIWVPPIADHSLKAVIGRPASLIADGKNSAGWSIWSIDGFRFKEFLANITQPQYIFFTIFFGSLFLLLIILVIIVLISKKTSSSLSFDEENGKEIEKITPEQSELIQLMQNMEKKLNDTKTMEFDQPPDPEPDPELIQKPPQKPAEPDEKPATYPRLNVSYEDWVAKFKEKKQEKAEDRPPDEPEASVEKPSLDDIDLPFLDVDHTKSINDEEIVNSTKSKLSSFFDKKLVLDPGSANRLYHEGLLGNFNQAHMTKSSAKRLQPNIAKLLQQIELNVQDLSKAQLFQERLETLEEAGKALALCKKKHIGLYITSYRLPNFIQRIQIVHIGELLKEI